MSRPDALPVTEEQVMKSLSHPLRTKLYYALFARGTARATDLAQELNVPTNQASFHLRFLAKYGLIEEAPQAGTDRRQRLWQPTSSTGIDPPSSLTTNAAYQEAGRRTAHKILDAYLDRKRPGFHHSNDITVHLSDEDAHLMATELQEALLRWNRRGQKPTTQTGTTDRHTYLVTVHIQPMLND